MSREYRNLVLNTKAAADLEEKRGLNYMPPTGSSVVGYHQRARKGGGLMPKGAKARGRLAKQAMRVASANAQHAEMFGRTRRGMTPADLARPQRGNWRSGEAQARELDRARGSANRTAFGAGRVAARLNRGGKIKF